MIRIYTKGYTEQELTIIRKMLDVQLSKLHRSGHCVLGTGCNGCPVRYLCSNLESSYTYVDRKLKVTKE